MWAEWNWIPGNEWGRDGPAHPFLCRGTGFLLAGLDPLIVCPRCCWWIMTKVKGGRGSSWVTGPKSRCQCVGLDQIRKSPMGSCGNVRNVWQNGKWYEAVSAELQISSLIVLFSSKCTIKCFNRSSGYVSQSKKKKTSSLYIFFHFISCMLSGRPCKSFFKINPAVIKWSQSSLLDSWDGCEDSEMKLLLPNKNTVDFPPEW